MHTPREANKGARVTRRRKNLRAKLGLLQRQVVAVIMGGCNGSVCVCVYTLGVDTSHSLLPRRVRTHYYPFIL